MTYKDFTDFLNDKFFKENPMTLDDEWPDKFSAWLDDQDCDTLVKYADEYADLRAIKCNDAILSLIKEMVPEEDTQGFGTATVSAHKTWNACREEMLKRLQ